MKLRSRIVSFGAKRITGWAYDADAPETQVTLRIEINGEDVGRVICNRVRKDLDPVEFPSQRIGFHTSVPMRFWTGQPIQVVLAEEGDGGVVKEAQIVAGNVCLETGGGRPLFGEITAARADRVEGWVTDLNGVLEVELEIDGVLVDVQAADGFIVIDEKRMAGFAFTRFPRSLYDGAEHVVRVLARGDRLVTVGEAAVPFPADAAPRFVGEVQPAAEGRLQGSALYPDDPDRVAEIVLTVGGLERARTLSQAGTGTFAFDLAALDVADWLGAEIALVNADGDLPLRYAGQHPVRDGMVVELRSGEGGVPALILAAPAPLPALLDVAIEAQDGSTLALAIANAERASTLAVPVTGRAPARNPRVVLNGLLLKGGTEKVAAAAAVVLPEPGERVIGDFVEPRDARVRRALTQRVRQAAGEPGEPGYSGGWVFEAPAEIRGWALDLADTRPLVVALMADGEIVALAHAKDRVVVREAGFRFETPTGFRFDLAAFSAMDGTRTIDVRVMPGQLPLHGKAVQVDLATLGVIASREARVDALVHDGALADAYLAARAALRKGGAGAPERLQALDFALRTEWRGYERALAAAEGRLSEAVLHRLRDASRGLDAKAPAPGTSGLPPVYDELVEAAVRARTPEAASLRTDRERIERAALWRTLQALPEVGALKSDYGKIALVVAHGPAEAVYEACYEAAAAAGCRVVRLAQASEAGAQALAEIARAEIAVVLRAPRLLGLAALAYWPALASSRSGPLAVSGADVLIGNPHDPDLEFAGFYEDADVRVLAADDAAGLQAVLAGTDPAPERQPGITAFRLVSPANLFCAGAPVVIHDSGAADTLPSIPGAFRLQPLPAADDRVAALSAILSELRLTLAPDTLIVVLDPAFEYPESYVEDVHRSFVLAGSAVSTVNTLVAYDPMKLRFYFDRAEAGQKVFLGHVALGGYRLGDLTESFARHGTGGRIVVATAAPFVHAPLADPVVKGDLVLASRKHFKGEGADPFELQKGFVGQTYASWTGAFQAKRRADAELDHAVRALSALTHVRAQVANGQVPKVLFREIEAVAQVGRPDVAREALLEFMALRAADGRISEDELRQMIDLARSLGLREELVRQLGFRALFSLSANADLIIPLFETFAVVLPRDQMAAAITAATALILTAPSNKSLYRIADVTRRYCDAEVMTMVVNLIANAGQTKIFGEERFAGIVGEALIGSAVSASSFVNERFGLTYFVSRASIRSKISQAMYRLDARQLCTEINRYFAEGRDVRELILLLRTYSSEMSDIGLAAQGIQYPHHADRDQRLALAIMFDDAEAIARYQGETASAVTVWDSLAIAAATYRQAFGPLKEAFAAWAEGQGIETPDFGGASIHEMFRRLLAAGSSLPAAAHDHGKVSVIVTVYNPDLELLDLALRSVLTQTYRNLEVILVDDASDETPAEAIAALAGLDPRIRFIRVPRNSGPYVCRNEALKIAEGAFVAIQDGDDFSHPQRIEKQVAQLAACPVYQMCTTSHLRIDRRARLQFEHTLGLRGDGTMTSMFRRGVFDVLGPFIRVRSRGDVEFRQRILKSHGAHAATHIDTPMVFCFAAPSSLSNTTARNLYDYLVAFRTSIDKTVAAPVLEGRRHAERCIDVEIPWPMRPL